MSANPIEDPKRELVRVTGRLESHGARLDVGGTHAVECNDDLLCAAIESVDAREAETRIADAQLAGLPRERAGLELDALLARSLDHSRTQQRRPGKTARDRQRDESPYDDDQSDKSALVPGSSSGLGHDQSRVTRWEWACA